MEIISGRDILGYLVGLSSHGKDKGVLKNKRVKFPGNLFSVWAEKKRGSGKCFMLIRGKHVCDKCSQRLQDLVSN